MVKRNRRYRIIKRGRPPAYLVEVLIPGGAEIASLGIPPEPDKWIPYGCVAYTLRGCRKQLHNELNPKNEPYRIIEEISGQD